MDIAIRGIPDTANDWQLTKLLATVIHSDEFYPTHDVERPERQLLLNFQVKVNINEKLGGYRNDTTGTLTLPTSEIGNKFLDWVDQRPIRMSVESGKPQKLRFRRRGRCHDNLALTLQRTPYVDPDREAEHAEILNKLDYRLRVDTVQFGVYYHTQYRSTGPLPSRGFSVEWEHDYVTDAQSAWLTFEYDHKLIRIRVGNETRDNQAFDININFSSINKIGGGYDGKPYLCFDTLTPPSFESINLYNSTGQKSKERVGYIHDAHKDRAPFACQMRLLLYNEVDSLDKFRYLCKNAGLGSQFRELKSVSLAIEATSQMRFFDERSLYRIRKTIAEFEWPVAFQLEALLYNGYLNTRQLEEVIPRVRKRLKTESSEYVGDLLRHFGVALEERPAPGRESPLDCFERVAKEFIYDASKLASGHFPCGHVTFTPTRQLLEGPYATQSNRIIRQYVGYEHNFLRVDFRDEDRLQYRWDRMVDGATFVRQRVGTVLKEGFVLGGKHFEFLAYSTSALRGHAVWFICPFYHPKFDLVNGDRIRHDIGDFRGKTIMAQPSKLAARIGQAFTATDPSVRILRDQWEEIPDIGIEPHIHTDGAGTISQSLADEIWEELCKERRDHGNTAIKPSAFQIRFLGYKGVVAVDKELDKHPDGIRMRLRKSMNKFSVDTQDAADIEIARAFDKPNASYLNRALVMVLEDKDVSLPVFQRLQETALADTHTIDDSLELFRNVLATHALGNGYRLTSLLTNIESLGFDIKSRARMPGIDTPFLQQLRQVAKIDVLREIKHQARIPIPGSFKLVGVPDEGPTYRGLEGYEDIFCLPANRIAACVHEYGKEPVWLEGQCTISRSPICHAGDVQTVFAVKPPEGQLCAFSHLVNVVVLPTQGSRSLASCLGGGDLDGDQYDVIVDTELLPPTKHKPADYPPGGTFTLLDDDGEPRECEVEDICDFIVEYINSDVVGLLSDRLLIIADQSKKGIHDPDCIRLAELCSQAVDYPKNGIPVDIDNNKLPKTLIRCKPDWHAAEVVDPRHTDYYRSDKVLGQLYRQIEWKQPDIDVSDKTPKSHVLSDSLSLTLRCFVERALDVYTDPDGKSPQIDKWFRRYAEELNYVCVTHTLSNTPGTKLLEAEVVVGTILAKCTQRRWRKDRMWKMRTHASQLVRDVKRHLFPLPPGEKGKKGEKEPVLVPLSDIKAGLKRAWEAWDYSLRNSKTFGAQSFGLIALDVVFDCLQRLNIDVAFRKV